MTSWIDICALADIPVSGARVVRRTPELGDIALFRNHADAVFALLDRCPHKGGPLSQGMVFADRIACPLHGWNLRFADGAAVAPDVGAAVVFMVRVDTGRVQLDAEELRTRSAHPALAAA